IHCFNKLESLNLYLDEDLIGKEKCSTVLFRSAKDLNLLTFVCTKFNRYGYNFIFELKSLAYFNLYGCEIENLSIFRFKRNNFLALKLDISLSCDEKLNSNLKIVYEKFG
ncbi:hypothetical protein CWI38_0004p0010, partial [Hamiltosporidium tvaerminnensis]